MKQAMIEWLGPVVVEYYAATEGVGTFVTQRRWLTKPGTVGKPQPPTTSHPRRRRRATSPAGEVGTVYLKAPRARPVRVLQGRRQDRAAATAATTSPSATSGYLDDDGYLFLTDRSANLIISGGVNIYPAEVDAVLLDAPGRRRRRP